MKQQRTQYRHVCDVCRKDVDSSREWWDTPESAAIALAAAIRSNRCVVRLPEGETDITKGCVVCWRCREGIW